MNQPTNILPDLSNQQPLGIACVSAILAELQARHGQEPNPRWPKVCQLLQALREELAHCTELDRARPAPVARMVTDESMPKIAGEAGSKGKHPLTVVYWRDSRQPITDWLFLDKLPKLSVVEARTVGFVVHEDEHTIALAPTMASHDQPDAQVMGIVQIPKAAVHLRLLLGVMPHSEP